MVKMFFQTKYLFSARYWDDPHTFNPSRFLKKDWPRDAFLPFSAGKRWFFFLLSQSDLFFFYCQNLQESVRALDESIWFFFLSD